MIINKRILSIILSCLFFSPPPSIFFATDHRAHEHSTALDIAVQVEVSVGHFEIEDSDDDEIYTHQFSAAFKINFDGAHNSTIKTNDRK
ncbi:hypothetical protein NBRC116602_04540 [Hyphomicrobiales bacterium 4NK60-0047b]|jgi:hypothetical protein